ncbi:MAG: DMT family transporter [Rhodospirillaceae bacterium]|nr:DMT family transporter [Rhodospirillaceae bacterium]
MSAPLTDTRRGIIAMCLSMVTFIVNDAMVKLASERLPMDQIVFIRGIFASLLLLAWLSIGQPWVLRFIRHRGMVRVGWRSVLDALSTFTYLWALFHLPLPNISAINLSSPLMVTVLAIFFLGEKVAWRRWSAIIVGLIGVMMIVQPSSDAFTWFSVVAVAATVLGAVRDVMTRRIALEIPSILVTFATAVAVATVAGISVAATGWTPVAVSDLLLLAGASVFLIGGYHFIIVAMRVAETSIVSPFRYTAILWAIILGYVLWGEVPNPLALAGIVVLVASGLYLMHRERLARLKEKAADA